MKNRRILLLLSFFLVCLFVSATANAKTAENINFFILSFFEMTVGNLTVTDNATFQQYLGCDFLTTNSEGIVVCGIGNISVNVSADGRMGTNDYWLYNTTSYILLNMTRINESIDARDADTDTRIGAGGYWLYNDTSLIYLNGTRLNETIDSRATGVGDGRMGTDDYFLYNDTSLIGFNATRLNETIDARVVGGEADGRMGTNDLYLYNDTSYIYMNTTTLLEAILSVGENHFFTGLTSGSHNGSFQFIGEVGYEAANALCDDDFSGSHMCQAWEIVNTINVYGTSGFALDGWISEVTPGYIADMDDCRGWTSDANSRLGSYFKFDDIRGAAINCANEIKIACCGEYTVPE